MKNILVLIHDDPGQESRVQAALGLGRALDGHLTCVSAIEPPAVLAGDFYGAAGQAVLLADTAEALARENWQRVEARLRQEDVAWSMTEVTGSLSDALAVNAGLADLIVLNIRAEGASGPDMRALASRLLLDTKKPVLAVPQGGAAFDPFKPALVAWDGSAPAFAALRAAIPLLRMASGVTLLQVVDGEEGTSAEEAAAYLSRHDIHPEIVLLQRNGAPIALAIIEECEKREAYCVMGAFGRSRMSEALFGGVSRRMLVDSPVALFLAH